MKKYLCLAFLCLAPCLAFTETFSLSPYLWEYGADIPVRKNTKFYVATETIDKQQKEVLTVEADLKVTGGTDGTWVGAQVVLERTRVSLISRIRQANGVRFNVLGDGKPWKIRFHTTETETDWCAYGYTIQTKRNAVIQVNIPFTSLRQPEWGAQVPFIKNHITAVSLETDTELTSGTTTIKVFDFEFY